MPRRLPPGTSAPITHPVARRIAEYWLAHPAAGDTAKGIREWWLSDTLGSAVNEEQVRQALQELMDLGVAEQEAGYGAQAPRFRLAVPVEDLPQRLGPGPAVH